VVKFWYVKYHGTMAEECTWTPCMSLEVLLSNRILGAMDKAPSNQVEYYVQRTMTSLSQKEPQHWEEPAIRKHTVFPVSSTSLLDTLDKRNAGLQAGSQRQYGWLD
jgi:hypothetical protein